MLRHALTTCRYSDKASAGHDRIDHRARHPQHRLFNEFAFAVRARRAEANISMVAWERFRDDPYRFLVVADNELQAKIWLALQRRQPPELR